MTEHALPRTMNPLWIISLFLGLSEVTAGVVATLSAGWVQGLLALFAVLFPVGTAVAFFFVLWHKPYVWYAPGDFSKVTNVSTFVEAMRISTTSRSRSMDALVRSAVEAALAKYVPADLSAQQKDVQVQQAIRTAHDEFERLRVSIDSSEVVARFGRSVPDRFAIVSVNEMTVQEFLDEVWAKLYPAFDPYTYGERWILENASTKQRYDSGSPGRPRAAGDTRTLREVGIEPGDLLRVVLLTR